MEKFKLGLWNARCWPFLCLGWLVSSCFKVGPKKNPYFLHFTSHTLLLLWFWVFPNQKTVINHFIKKINKKFSALSQCDGARADATCSFPLALLRPLAACSWKHCFFSSDLNPSRQQPLVNSDTVTCTISAFCKWLLLVLQSTKSVTLGGFVRHLADCYQAVPQPVESVGWENTPNRL